MVSPYNVTVSFADTPHNGNQLTIAETIRQQPSLPYVAPKPADVGQQFIQPNTIRMDINDPQQSFVRRTGPQLKYVPARPLSTQIQQNVQLSYSNSLQSQLSSSFTGYTPRQPTVSSRPSLPNDRVRYPTELSCFATTAPRMSTVPHQQRLQHFAPRSSVTHQPNLPQSLPQNVNVNQTYHYIARPNQPPDRLLHAPSQRTHNQPPSVPNNRRPPVPVDRTLQSAATHVTSVRRNLPTLHNPPNLVAHTNASPLPSKPHVNINVTENGIVLSWDNDPVAGVSPTPTEYYHLLASQDSQSPPSSSLAWKKIGVVKALPLPMACTLTQFASGNSYHFAIRSVDIYGREGPLSNPCTVTLN